jgi:hypothetical protein
MAAPLANPWRRTLFPPSRPLQELFDTIVRRPRFSLPLFFSLGNQKTLMIGEGISAGQLLDPVL